MTPAIHVEQLIKRFRRTAGFKDIIPGRSRGSEVLALGGVDLAVREGELFGLVGPNGAGKTTLIKILSTLVLPTSGHARVFGFDVARQEKEVKKLVGLAAAEERSFYWRLTGWENMRFFAALYGMSGKKGEARIQELLDLVGMSEQLDRRFQDYSTGMKQKLAIARGLLCSPKLLFMDEPTRSLDPLIARDLRGFIRKEIVERQGRTVLLTTHQMSDVEELCDRVAIMKQGRIVACGTMAELRSCFQKHLRCEMEISGLADGALPSLKEVPGVVGYSKTFQENGTMTVEVNLRDGALSGVLKAIFQQGAEVKRCNMRETPLEDIFAQVVEGSPEEAQADNVPWIRETKWPPL